MVFTMLHLYCTKVSFHTQVFWCCHSVFPKRNIGFFWYYGQWMASMNFFTLFIIAETQCFNFNFDFIYTRRLRKFEILMLRLSRSKLCINYEITLLKTQWLFLRPMKCNLLQHKPNCVLHSDSTEVWVKLEVLPVIKNTLANIYR